MSRNLQFILYMICLWLFNYHPSAAAQHGIVALPLHINTPFANLAPLRHADKLFFTTALPAENDGMPGNLVSARIAGGRTHQVLDDFPKEHQYIANMALMPDASRMYFSICEDGNLLLQNKCTIWCREKSYEGKWLNPVKLPRHINLKGSSSTQPSIGFDQTQKKFVLFFVSDRVGGKGGKDIWASSLEPDGTYGPVLNLPINTVGDDVTPFFHGPSQTLFFSTNGLAGIGGFDIYQAEKTNSGTWRTSGNLGELVNTWADELYFTYHSPTGLSYFASNRPSNLHDETSPETNFNIYEMEAVIELELLALDEATSIPVFGTTAEVWEKGSERPQFFREQPFDDGLFIQLEGGFQYHIILRAKGYEPLALELNAQGLMGSKSMRRKVFLKKETPGKLDFGSLNQRPLAQPARFLNTSPKAIFDLRKADGGDLLGLPF